MAAGVLLRTFHAPRHTPETWLRRAQPHTVTSAPGGWPQSVKTVVLALYLVALQQRLSVSPRGLPGSERSKVCCWCLPDSRHSLSRHVLGVNSGAQLLHSYWQQGAVQRGTVLHSSCRRPLVQRGRQVWSTPDSVVGPVGVHARPSTEARPTAAVSPARLRPCRTYISDRPAHSQLKHGALSTTGLWGSDPKGRGHITWQI